MGSITLPFFCTTGPCRPFAGRRRRRESVEGKMKRRSRRRLFVEREPTTSGPALCGAAQGAWGAGVDAVQLRGDLLEDPSEEGLAHGPS